MLRIIGTDGTKSAPVTGTPKTDARGQGGMMGVGVPGDGWIYWSYAEPREGGNGLAVARGKLGGTKDAPAVSDVAVIFRMMPTLDSTKHFGGPLKFAADGTLFVMLGERSDLPGRVQAQNLGSDFGKIVRINRDGIDPEGQSLCGEGRGAAGDLVVRPPQHPVGGVRREGPAVGGRTWPAGGDELNLVKKGSDYGWPTISYGKEYAGGPIGKGITQAPGMVQPVYYWDPVIAPAGMVFYSGKLVPEWKGNVLIGGLGSKALVRLVMANDKVVGEERLLTGRSERIRDVVEGPGRGAVAADR